MREVPQVPYSAKLKLEKERVGCCDRQYKLFGTLGLCKKHSIHITQRNMTLPRFIYWKLHENIF